MPPRGGIGDRVEAGRRAGGQAGAGAGGIGAVVGGGDVGDGAAQHDGAPLLVEARVVDEVRGLDVAGALGHDRAHQERVVELGAEVQPVRVEAPRDLAGQGGGGHADAARLFQRQGAGDAVAEIGGKGCHAPAAVTGVFRVGGEVAHRRCREEVEERLGKPEGEAGELDEAAVGVEAFRGRRVTGVADEEVGAQHPVVGLLAGIDRDHRAGAYGGVGPARAHPVEVEPERGAAVVVDVRPEERRLGRVLPVAVVELRPHISAELEADIGSGDVVEAVPVQIADLHVLGKSGQASANAGSTCGCNRGCNGHSAGRSLPLPRPRPSPSRCASKLATAFASASGMRCA